MKRRRYLALATATAASSAGCVVGYTGEKSDSSGTSFEGVERPPPELPVPDSELQRSVGRDVIGAIVDPVFGEDWSDVTAEVVDQFGERTVEPRLNDDDVVIGVVGDDQTRAYPLRVLNWHEVVNDRLDGPLLVTYCPLCRSGVTAESRR